MASETKRRTRLDTDLHLSYLQRSSNMYSTRVRIFTPLRYHTIIEPDFRFREREVHHKKSYAVVTTACKADPWRHILVFACLVVAPVAEPPHLDRLLFPYALQMLVD